MERMMTFAALARLRHKQAAARGFTLIEIMVTIGVIVLLAGILLPAIMSARSSARRTRMAQDLNTIAVGLEAYKQDFGDYPRLPPGGPQPTGVSPSVYGSQLLCWALVAPADINPPVVGLLNSTDGADGP